VITLLVVLSIVFIASVIWSKLAGWWDITPIIIALTTGMGLMFSFMAASKWQISSETLTGYVYSRSESWGYAEYELRFSQNAGMDTQPSFCVRAGSEADNAYRQVVGKNTKVTVEIPPTSYRLSGNLFECNSQANLPIVVPPTEPTNTPEE
jgi:hypothetical protein